MLRCHTAVFKNADVFTKEPLLNFQKYNWFVHVLVYTLYVVVGFPRSTQERAQCCVHAASLGMVGDRERHCEEHVPHLAAGCALFQPCPYRCYC